MRAVHGSTVLYPSDGTSTAALVGAGVTATGGRIVVAEDHHPEGGVGSAVADALLAAGVQKLVDA